MTLKTPRWWYRRSGAPWPIGWFLTPLSRIWAATTARRIARTTPFAPPIPVICVGNLTVGGTGKTPIVRELARRLGAHVLSRGHGGRLAGPVRVDPASHTSADVGDEPLMLAHGLPVWISRDRAAGVWAAAAAGATIVVMDDGHQNPSVKKALSLIVVDGETGDDEWPFGDGSIFPAGPMREPLATGLARADAVIVMLPANLAAPDPQLLALFGELPVLVARLEPANLPPSGPQVVFAGVGKPWKVERALFAAGCDIAAFTAFADHAEYSETTLAGLAATAKALHAGLVTTEKDWMRLPADWRARVVAWPVRARFEDEAALEVLLRAVAGP